ncbi:RNA 2'-phosphotransferase [Kosakonia sp. BK9b]
MNKKQSELSKFLSYVLRHEPQAIDLTLDAEGWASVDALIAGAARQGYHYTPALIQEIVDTSDKKRFTLSADGARIRAAQGHSTSQVKISYTPVTPPGTLYHGTATRFLEDILAQGLEAKSRQYVHLSADEVTATTVGQRHGKPVVLRILAGEMHAQGFVFYQADNGVWLTEAVPAAFIQQ